MTTDQKELGDEERDGGRCRFRPWMGVAALTAIGAALRFYGLGSQPLWLDEATTAAFGSRPFMGALFAEIQHPPLYYVVAHLAIRILGSSDAALRLPSALFGAATVPICWWLFRLLVPERRDAAWVGLSLVATSPFLVAMSQEARSYALMYLLTAASTTLFLCFVKGRHRAPTVGAYALLSVLLVHTHYFGAWVLLAHEIVYWRHSRARVCLWLLARAAAIGACIPWAVWVLPRLLAGSAFQPRDWNGPVWLRLPYAFMVSLIGYGPAAANRARLDDPWTTIFWQEAPVVVPSLAVLGWLAIRGIRLIASDRYPELRTWLVSIVLIPVAALTALSPWMRLVQERYLGFQMFWLLLALALGLVTLPRVWRRTAGVTAATIIAFALVAYHGAPGSLLGYTFRYGKEDWPGAAAFVARHEPDVVILAPSYLRLAYDRYAPTSPGQPDRILVREGDGALPDLGDANRIALVMSHEGLAEEQLLQRLDQSARRVDEATFPAMASIRVYIFERAP